MGRNSAMLKAESIGDVIIAKLRRRLTSIAVRRTTIEPIFICKPHHEAAECLRIWWMRGIIED
jgi:hypothetical protein